jgi:hypothetical protein
MACSTMEVLGLYRTLVMHSLGIEAVNRITSDADKLYKKIRCHIHVDNNRYSYCHDNLKS